MGPIERFFSDRRRWRNAAACAAIAALLSLYFVYWARSDGPSFQKILREPGRWIGALVGPGYLQVLSSSAGEVILEVDFKDPLRFRLPEGPEGAEVRHDAALLGPGDWVSAAGIYEGGLVFEARRLLPEPNRKLKFLVSGAAALAVLGALATRYRWSRGALRPREDRRAGGQVPTGGS
jgi:hypothetical protein